MCRIYSPELQHDLMVQFYKEILNINKARVDQRNVSALKQAWSKVILPSSIYPENPETCNLKIGDIVFMEFGPQNGHLRTITNGHPFRVITNVIDELGDVHEPGWQHSWQWSNLEKTVSDGIIRYGYI